MALVKHGRAGRCIVTATVNNPVDLQEPQDNPALLSGVSQPELTTRRLLALSSASLVAVVLGSLSLSSILIGGGWFARCLIVVVCVVALCTALTAIGLPLFFIPIVAGFGLLCAVTALFCDNGTLGLFPNFDSLDSLRALLIEGQTNVNQYAPPVPVSMGLACLISLSLGAVAALVYLLTVNLRLPTWACIPVLALYVVPAFVVEGGAPLWAFVIVIAGCLVLLATDQRVLVSAWGRSVSSDRQARSSDAPTGLSVAALRLGALSLIVAVLVSLALPGLSDSALNWFNAQHALNAAGGDDTSPARPIGLNPLVSLRRDLLNQPNGVMFTYKSDNPTPAYFRTAVLSAYNGETFYPLVAGTGVLPSTPRGTALLDTYRTQSGWTYQFVDQQLSSPYLPMPEGFFDVKTDQPGWVIDPGTMQVSGGDTLGASWTVTAGTSIPSPSALRAAPNLAADEQKNLLTGVPRALIDQAKGLTARSATKYDAALAIQQWLRDTFTYSTDVESNESASYLTQFLADRKGYCEQFAATMALMARGIGIPSRVVVGFTAGTKQKDGTWSVSPHQAHAWPELYLGQWVRFEPTPRAQVDGSGVIAPTWSLPNVAPAKPITIEPSHNDNARNRRDQELRRDRRGTRPVVDLGAPSSSAPATSTDHWRWIMLILAGIAGIAAAIAPAVRRWWRRRNRLASGDIDQAWDELRDTIRDIGVPWSDSATPRQVAATMIGAQHLRGDAAEAATRLCEVTELSRYSPRTPRTGRLADDVRTVRRALLTRMDRRTRIMATVRPASLHQPPLPDSLV